MLQMDMNEKIIKPLLKAAYERHGEDESALQTYLDKVKKNPSEFSPWVVGVEDKTIERFNEENEEKIDLEAFKNGKLALIESFYRVNSFYFFNFIYYFIINTTIIIIISLQFKIII